MSCCGGAPAAAEHKKEKEVVKADAEGDSIRDSVKEYYGKVLSSSKDLKSNACTASGAPHPLIREALRKVPAAIKDRFYGCGTPLPLGIAGLHVLDLGSGSGRDCYLAAQLVGERGSVTGVDMTDEQLAVAREHVDAHAKALGYAKPNLRFLKGYIELLKEAGIADGSMDLVISNCVVNLSPNKRAVLQGVYNALREGGEFYFSDVYCDRRLPAAVAKDPVLYGECLAGALYLQDFYRICHQLGFTDPRIVSQAPIDIDEKLQPLLGNAKFTSITFRLFKLKSLETLCEDYGQVAVYKGSIAGHPHSYPLDGGHAFVTNKPMLVCGNTASMLSETWLQPHFRVTGDRSTHFGLFDCGPKPAAAAASASVGASDAKASCSGGSCC